MNIAVIGTGYVGLVTGTCLSEVGHTVVCVDIDEPKIEQLRKGVIPIYEPGLSDLVARNAAEGRLRFSTDIREAIQSSDVVFGAVGTPPKANHEADLKYVKQVARDFAEALNGYKLFVIKSTVPVGTSHEVKAEIQAALAARGQSEAAFDVVSNPEFLREGTAVRDFMSPNRIVVGLDPEGNMEQARALMQKLYDPFVRVGSPLLFTDVRSSEIIKYASNAFLATKISFINEIAALCDIVGGDVKEIAKGMGLDQRIGARFLHAGVGYGGSCFPKDVKALIQTGKSLGHEFKILEAVEEVNHGQHQRLFKKLQNAVGDLTGKTIAVWGLSFKPKTDDIREAPAIDLIQRLATAGAHVQAFDPVAQKNAQAVLTSESVAFVENPYAACREADALLVMTEWDEFRILDFDQLKRLMKGHVVVDGRNLYERSEVEQEGFTYFCFGR